MQATCRGTPARVSICHCLECKKRTGSAFSYNATYREDQVSVAGDYATYHRVSDEGYRSARYFCRDCGSTVFYEIEVRPGMIAVPVGGFADTDFAEPMAEVYGERRPGWCIIRTEGPLTEE